MSEHLSDFTLDEVVVGGPRPAHLEDCGPCQRRLEQLRAYAEAVRAQPRFAHVRTRVLEHAKRPERPAASAWRPLRWFVPMLATAAVALLVVRGPLAWMTPMPGGPDAPGTRLKGSPAVELLRMADGQASPVLRKGEQVALRLQGAGYRYALVVAQEASGEVEMLWPSTSRWSGELIANPAAPLFQVTEGDFVVHAFYSDVPLELDEVRDWLALHGPECSKEEPEDECLAPAELSARAAHVAVAQKVEERP